MRPLLVLESVDRDGNERRIEVRSSRVTIGRGSDADFAIPVGGISRLHAVIEEQNGEYVIMDCGSQNGTSVNGEAIDDGVILEHGDVIVLGGALEIAVVFADEATIGGSSISSETMNDEPVQESRAPRTRLAWFVVAVLIAVGFATIWDVRSVRGRDDADLGSTPTERPDDRADVPDEPAVVPTPAEPSRIVDAGISADQLEKALQQVMRRVSSDETSYVFPETALDDVRREVDRLRHSSTAPAALGSVQHQGRDIAGLARNCGLQPEMAIYAALADTDFGGAGNPGARARELVPDFDELRKTFGSEKLADGSLLILAAYKSGGVGTKKSHPLLAVLRKGANRVVEERNVWALYEKGVISPQAYSFVVRFLAAGAIAQNPRIFGIAADPLAI